MEKSAVLTVVAAVPAILLCFVLATGGHFLIFGGKIVPAVAVGVYMTVMFIIFLISEPSSSPTSG